MYDYNYSYYNYGRTAAWLSGGAIAIYIALAVFMIVVMWRIFTKAGEAGWKCLIPIYSTYIFYKIAWDGSIFWGILIGNIVVSLLAGVIPSKEVSLALYGIWAIIMIVISVKTVIKLAHRFGKSTAFGIFGLLLFSIIGMPILAFGSADYDGRRDV